MGTTTRRPLIETTRKLGPNKLQVTCVICGKEKIFKDEVDAMHHYWIWDQVSGWICPKHRR